MKPSRTCRSARPTAPFALPAHWSPKQALAVFECIELMRDQLWLAYGPDIQHAWRGQHQPTRPPRELDPDAPF